MRRGNVSSDLIPPFITSLIFAGSIIAAKFAVFEMDPVIIILIRYLLAIIFLLTLLPHYGLKSLKVKFADLPVFILMGLFGIVGYHYFFFSSLNYTLVNKTAIINAFSPVVTGILAAIFINEKLSFINYTGILIAVTGVLGLISGGDTYTLFTFDMNKGDLLMLCAVISWAIYSLIVKRYSRKFTSYSITLYSSITGVIILTGLTFIENSWGQLKSLSTISYLSLIYMGVLASGVGYIFYNVSIRKIGPTKTSSAVYCFVPVVVALLAYPLFDEILNTLSLVCMILILIGLNLSLSRKSNTAT